MLRVVSRTFITAKVCSPRVPHLIRRARAFAPALGIIATMLHRRCRPRFLSLTLLAACSGSEPADSASDGGSTSAAASGLTDALPTTTAEATSEGTADATSAGTADVSTGTTGAPEMPGDPVIVYFNYDPTDDPLVNSSIDLQVARGEDGFVYLSDAAVVPDHTSYYALNGSVARLDARGLSARPVPVGRWLHLVKFVADIDNINTEGWQTSWQYTGGNGTKFAAAFETSFYIDDGTTPPPPGHTEPLWTAAAVEDALIFKATPPFSLPASKRYGSESTPLDEPADNLAKVGWYTAPDKFRLLYAGEVAALMAAVGAQKPNGVASFDDITLKKAADWLAAATPAATFAVDFEPADPAQDAWMWDYEHPNFRAAMRKLSDYLYESHGRRFYSWIDPGGQTFDHHGVKLVLNGYTSGNWGGEGGTLDDALLVHADPAGISNIDRASDYLTQVGFGYTSTVINGGDPADGPEVWRSPTTWYLRALDVLNLETLIAGQTEFLAFLWPYEDVPSDAKRTPMTRFSLPGAQGLIRQTDNRVIYPPNLVRDAIVTYLVNPRVTYTNYWIFGESYRPETALKYAQINGVQSCEVADLPDFHVYEYTGPDTPPCPALPGNYIGKDVLGVGAMVQGHEIFARHLAATLDGTQVRDHLDEPFRYTRGDGVEQVAEWQPDTGEFARAFKFGQPWVQVWQNPQTQARVLLFQDVFAEGFEPIEFTVRIDGAELAREAVGNNLYYEVLE